MMCGFHRWIYSPPLFRLSILQVREHQPLRHHYRRPYHFHLMLARNWQWQYRGKLFEEYHFHILSLSSHFTHPANLLLLAFSSLKQDIEINFSKPNSLFLHPQVEFTKKSHQLAR